MDPHTLNEHWDAIRELLERDWPTLTPDELDNVDGNLEKLRGLMSEKLGQPLEALDRYLDGLRHPPTGKPLAPASLLR